MQIKCAFCERVGFSFFHENMLSELSKAREKKILFFRNRITQTLKEITQIIDPFLIYDLFSIIIDYSIPQFNFMVGHYFKEEICLQACTIIDQPLVSLELCHLKTKSISPSTILQLNLPDYLRKHNPHT